MVTLGWPCWIGVVADDLDRQRRFYGDVLGFTKIAEGADWVQFDLGESRCLRSCGGATSRNTIKLVTRSDTRSRISKMPGRG